jgi:transcription initiation factor IIE alpha subunit
MRQIIEDLREVDVEMAAQVEEMVGDLEVKAEYEQQNDFFVRG